MTETQLQTTNKKQMSIGELLAAQRKQIEAALPKHLKADRMLRIIMTEIRKVPKLKTCTAESLVGAVILCSQLGLEPGGALGHAYLIPYEVNRNMGTKTAQKWVKQTECQFQIGYRGMIDLARRSRQIVSISAKAFYENDKFEVEFGLNEKLSHVPTDKDRGALRGVYAVAHLVGGGHQIEVMYRSEIDAIRARSKTSSNGPWVTDYEEMAKKTVIRRMFKYLPVSIEIMDAITLDDRGEEGAQRNSSVIDGSYERLLDDEDEPDTAIQTKADEVAATLDKQLTKKKETVQSGDKECEEAKDYFKEV